MVNEHRYVIILNHFARSSSTPGGTRHADLLDNLDGWRGTVLASNRGPSGKISYRKREGALRYVSAPAYAGAGVRRVASWGVFSLVALWRGLRHERPSVVIGSSPHLLAALAGWGLARLRRAAFVLEVRDLWPAILVEMGILRESSVGFCVLDRIADYLYRKAEFIIVLAHGTAQVLEDRGIPRHRIICLPNGVSIGCSEASEPGIGQKSAAFASLVRPIFVYAGAHGPANGLDKLLDVAKVLQDRRVPCTFALIGEGPAKAALQERAKEEALLNVTFHEPVPKSHVPAILRRADCGLHILADVPLFRWAVSPNKILDYMACGLPVITNVPGVVGDMVLEAGAGQVVEPNGLLEGVLGFLSANDSQRESWGRSGAAYVEAERSVQVLAEKLEDLLDSVVADRPTGSPRRAR